MGKSGWQRILSAVGLGRPGKRKWIVLGCTILVMAAAVWLEHVPGASATGLMMAAQAFCSDIVTELGHLQPQAILDIFGKRVADCSDCGAFGILSPGHLFGAVAHTLGDVLADATGATWLVLLLAFCVGGGALYYVWTLWRGDVDDWTFLDGLLLVVLLPAAASLAALLLQGLATLFFGALGALIGLVLFLWGTIGGIVWAAYKFWTDYTETREKVEAAVEAVEHVVGSPRTGAGTVQPPPPGPPPAAH